MVVACGYRQRDLVQVVTWRIYGFTVDTMISEYHVPLRVIEAAQRIGDPCCILFTPLSVQFARSCGVLPSRLAVGMIQFLCWFERFLWTILCYLYLASECCSNFVTAERCVHFFVIVVPCICLWNHEQDRFCCRSRHFWKIDGLSVRPITRR